MDPRLFAVPFGLASFLIEQSQRLDAIHSSIHTIMSSIVVEVVEALRYQTSKIAKIEEASAAKVADLLGSIATLQEELAIAKASDAADAESIASANFSAQAARASADAAQANAADLAAQVAELEAYKAADILEDEQIRAEIEPILAEKAAAEVAAATLEVPAETSAEPLAETPEVSVDQQPAE